MSPRYGHKGRSPNFPGRCYPTFLAAWGVTTLHRCTTPENYSGKWLLGAMSCDTYGGLYTNLDSQNVIEYLKHDFDHGRCQLINQRWVEELCRGVISQSGKYLAIL